MEGGHVDWFSLHSASCWYVATILAKVLVCEWGLSAIENALVPFVYCLFSGPGAILLGSAADRWDNFICFYTSSF